MKITFLCCKKNLIKFYRPKMPLTFRKSLKWLKKVKRKKSEKHQPEYDYSKPKFIQENFSNGDNYRRFTPDC